MAKNLQQYHYQLSSESQPQPLEDDVLQLPSLKDAHITLIHNKTT